MSINFKKYVPIFILHTSSLNNVFILQQKLKIKIFLNGLARLQDFRLKFRDSCRKL